MTWVASFNQGEVAKSQLEVSLRKEKFRLPLALSGLAWVPTLLAGLLDFGPASLYDPESQSLKRVGTHCS